MTDEVEFTTSLTPSGIEVWYSWAPRRHYKVRIWDNELHRDGDHIGEFVEHPWTEVPSVTTALDVLDNSGPLIWWGQRVGIQGVFELLKRGIVRQHGHDLIDVAGGAVTPEDVVTFLVQQKLSTNHVRDRAADRGTAIHTIFETWCEHPEFRPAPDIYEPNEQGYVRALTQFLDDIADANPRNINSEIMVGSIEFGFAGRYDCRLDLDATELVVKSYPKRKPKVEEIPAGRYLLDLKTSKGVYSKYPLQLEAYELASVECGYGPTDYRAVIHLTEDGRYELVTTKATAQDFLTVLETYKVMQQAKGWT